MTILITGSNKGLGKELAKRFAQNENNILIHGRDKLNIETTATEIKSQYPKISVLKYVSDLSKEPVDRLADIAISSGVSTLINNAAVSQIQYLNEEITEDLIQTNMIAPINLTKLLFPYFEKQGNGKIVNILSVDILNPKQNRAGYTASKKGLEGFMESLRFEAKNKNIRITNVYLGGMDTDMYKKSGAGSSLCMNPKEVAEIIFQSTKTYEKTGVDSITINRQKY